MSTAETKPFFEMIVGNPPYQKNISGSTTEKQLRNASKSLPVYQEYVSDLHLAAANVVLVTPARWVAGGWGLDEFRQKLLNGVNLHEMWLFNNSATVFENTSINGGVNIIRFNEEPTATVKIKNFDRFGIITENGERLLLEKGADFFVRDGHAVSILHKIRSFDLPEDQRFSSFVNGAISGFNSNFKEYTEEKIHDDDLRLVLIKWRDVWVSRKLSKDRETDGYRVLFQLSHGEGDPSAMTRAFLYGPGTTYTHSHLGTNAVSTEEEGMSVLSYINTRFFRYLCFILKITIVATSKVYKLAPIQTWDRIWTDEELFEKYGFSKEEIAHIERTITPPREIHLETGQDHRRAYTQ